MDFKKLVDIIGIIELILVIYGVISAIFFSNVFWYDYFTIGGTFFLGYINYKINNKSIFEILEKNKTKFFKMYFLYVIAAIVIELIGRFILNFWDYPSLSPLEKVIHSFLIGYPFAFFFINESFILINKKIKLFSLALVSVIIINAFVHEIPNTFAWAWVYTIPYVTFEILHINIVVIVGWIVLVCVPLIVNKILNK